ncbi:hypothetical protein M3689_04480 [Alkalihalophilus marmarensis]|jgi:hypothetical protein|uniref:Uncharacterized protein n=1 Tax=Alkalihalophilus marmarensis DSM 21297 TaxID=1188261 RepID=U6STX6_9BACI|nr:hypothetical protein [Alkalihalophilus marmarensis]ERN54817.1 hypothetical protein A33I_05580 [Alkalihalophilus marmarensis DSM 21297]MCM3488564.1 hypothetical protein [Alkalihalophilus marmarensis]
MRKYEGQRYEDAFCLHSMHRYFPQDKEPELDNRKAEGHVLAFETLWEMSTCNVVTNRIALIRGLIAFVQK